VRTSIHHTRLQNLPSGRLPGSSRNVIIRSFVASRKKYLFLKRAIDLAVSSLVILLLLSWLVPLVAICIKLGSKGPVFFLQRRMGKNEIPFTCIKFRTMIQNDEADERPAARYDERVTRAGRFLRLTNLDEIPQFINVWLGHMSIVGPRPHMVADCIRFSFVISSYSFRSLVRPGITGWAQVNGYHGPTEDYESIIIRYYWDAQYIRKLSLWLDLRIMSTTFTQSIRNLFRVIISSRHPNNEAILVNEMKDKKQVRI
jgi:putative colanic acid biosysnthesis UDP-glucose lipid carrier transferase